MGCSEKPSDKDMIAQVQRSISDCGRVINLVNFKKVNGFDINEKTYDVDVEYDLLLKNGIKIPVGIMSSPYQDVRCIVQYFDSSKVESGYIIYNSGERKHVKETLHYIKSDKGWVLKK